MNRSGLDEFDRRLSAMETMLAWLLAAAWLCAAVVTGLVVWAVLV